MTETEKTQDAAVEMVTNAAAESIPDDTAPMTAEELLELTVAELTAYAASREIDLGGVKLKADIVDAILGGVELSHYGPVLDKLIMDAGIPIGRVISRQFKVGKSSVAVGWFDTHGTPVGRFLGITPNQAEQIRDELNDFALRGLDTLTSAAHETRQ